MTQFDSGVRYDHTFDSALDDWAADRGAWAIDNSRAEVTSSGGTPLRNALIPSGNQLDGMNHGKVSAIFENVLPNLLTNRIPAVFMRYETGLAGGVGVVLSGNRTTGLVPAVWGLDGGSVVSSLNQAEVEFETVDVGLGIDLQGSILGIYCTTADLGGDPNAVFADQYRVTILDLNAAMGDQLGAWAVRGRPMIGLAGTSGATAGITRARLESVGLPDTDAAVRGVGFPTSYR